MTDPYEVLGVARDADDEVIRKAYLALVREFSPDLDPSAFKEIQAAYEQVKDEKSRLNYYLFDTGIPGETPFQTFLNHVAQTGKREPMEHTALKEFLKACAKK